MSILKSNTHYLVMMDMDSTLIENEVIDDLAESYGVGSAVKEITESAMRGEIDFAESLSRRVALLAGADIKLLENLKNMIRITPGAQQMIDRFRSLGFKTCVVSGGFDVIISDLAKKLNIDNYRANQLEIINNKLTGCLTGNIIDANGKRDALLEMAEIYQIPLDCTIAIGDGANDIPMIEQAEIGIAFNAKPALANMADLVINAESLVAVLDKLEINIP
jgi:phosphoserine phosphatase